MYEDKCVPLVLQTQSCISKPTLLQKIECKGTKSISAEKVQESSNYLFTYFVA